MWVARTRTGGPVDHPFPHAARPHRSFGREERVEGIEGTAQACSAKTSRQRQTPAAELSDTLECVLRCVGIKDEHPRSVSSSSKFFPYLLVRQAKHVRRQMKQRLTVSHAATPYPDWQEQASADTFPTLFERCIHDDRGWFVLPEPSQLATRAPCEDKGSMSPSPLARTRSSYE